MKRIFILNAYIGGALLFLFLTLCASTSAQQPPPQTSPASQKSKSIFQRERSPVTWKTVTQPLRDLADHVAKAMGWKEGFRAGFEKGVRTYLSSDRALELLGFAFEAGLTILFAFFAWRFLSQFLHRIQDSTGKKPATIGVRWSLAWLRIARDVLTWGLVAAAGSLTIDFLKAHPVIQDTAIAILLSIAGYRVGRSVLMEFLNPETPTERLVRCGDAGARHFFDYLSRMLFFAAIWWPLIQFFDAINYHYDFQELLLLIFRIVIFFLLILLVSNKRLVLAVIPTGTAMGRRIAHWVQTIYPALIGYILGLFGLYSLGYHRLARFILTSSAYSCSSWESSFWWLCGSGEFSAGASRK